MFVLSAGHTGRGDFTGGEDVWGVSGGMRDDRKTKRKRQSRGWWRAALKKRDDSKLQGFYLCM